MSTISNVGSTATTFSLPAKLHMDSASASFFGSLLAENTNQFATLDTANEIASLLGGTVVDMGAQWTGGSQTPQYGIQFGDGGPILNAGLIAQRCESCGVEAGLSAALVEAKSLTGTSLSIGDAITQVQQAEARYLAARTSTQTTTTASTSAASTSTVATSAATTDSTVASAALSTASDELLEAVDSKDTEQTTASTDSASSSAPSATTGDTTDSTSSDLTAMRKAAKEFEALMIGQMLKSIRESSSGGWLGSDAESSTVSAVELAEGQLAQGLSNQGGMGLADLVMRGLERHSTTTPSSGQPT